MPKAKRGNLFSCINPLAFFLALGVGLMIAYGMSPAPRLVLQFPTPGTCGKVVYRQPNGECYTYKAHEVDCKAHPEARPHPPTTLDGGAWREGSARAAGVEPRGPERAADGTQYMLHAATPYAA